MVLADLDGDGKPKVCVNHSDAMNAERFTVVDGTGREYGDPSSRFRHRRLRESPILTPTAGKRWSSRMAPGYALRSRRERALVRSV